MKAVVLQEINRIEITDVPDCGKPGPGELLIAPQKVGICGSDVHYYKHGRIGDFVLTSPMILGHEASGIVLEVGEGVEGFAPGDRVAMEPGIPDFSSRAARIGMYNVDPAVRFWATPPVDGCLVERVRHPAALTFKLPDSVSLEAAALIEPLAVGVHAASKAAIKPGDIAVVSGCGTVGMLTAMSALAAGAAKVLVADFSTEKLSIAAQTPGIVPIDLNSEDLLDAVKEHTDGWGADIVFEASGALGAYKTLWQLGCPGNRTVLIGMPPENVSVDVVAMQVRETRVETIFRYANVYQKAVDLLGTGRIVVDAYVTDTFAFDDAVNAFERVAENNPADIKIQISLTDL